DIRGLTQLFKAGDPEWEDNYNRFMEELRADLLPREVLQYQVDYAIYQLSREMQELNKDYQDIWFSDTVPRLNVLFKSFETFDELNAGLRHILRDTQARMASLREDRSFSATMKEVRQ